MVGSTITSNVNSNGGIPYDYSIVEKNHYSARPPTFSGDSTQFKWWKSKMCTYIIHLDNELWDILEYDINIEVNGVGMVNDRKLPHQLRRKFTENIIELEAF